MQRKEVAFYSSGLKLIGDLYLPETASPSRQVPGIVLCQGFGSTKEYVLPGIAQEFARAGYAALAFDYRGFGGSEGPRWRLIPLEQVEDSRNALTFLQAQPEVDPRRIGLYGTSFGGGIAVYAAAVDKRARCTVCVGGFGDGERKYRAARTYWDWVAWLKRLEADRTRRVLTGQSELVDPEEILARDPASKEWRAKVMADRPTMQHQLPLESGQAIIEFKPERLVHEIAPRALLVIHTTEDMLTPLEEAERLYEKAGEPKRIFVVEGARHHEINYGEPYRQAMDECLLWYGKHL